MDFLRSHRKISSAVAAFMVAVLVVYSYGSFRSYAASPEASTLPADNIGAEVNVQFYNKCKSNVLYITLNPYQQPGWKRPGSDIEFTIQRME